MSNVTEEAQRAVAAALRELDEATDVLAEKFKAVAEHVQAGHLSEHAIIAKVMEIQAKLQGQA